MTAREQVESRINYEEFATNKDEDVCALAGILARRMWPRNSNYHLRRLECKYEAALEIIENQRNS